MKREKNQHVLQAILEAKELLLESMIPKESQIHFRQANKEILIGIRAWIDHHIMEMEHSAKTGTSMSSSNHQTVQKIKISDY
ncbi:hypothetical protein [Bacillus sp. V2I10]|uniref:hypothetical protein n=1 Tax=Bacillus sp. V2I10 TaxID=3042276 RepID=UPI00277F7382|nr:hypothetical protein [Bacillus sp. V2I10]MDQ0860989.1 hypothetical protein [Bacillus sp. V2I10]